MVGAGLVAGTAVIQRVGDEPDALRPGGREPGQFGAAVGGYLERPLPGHPAAGGIPNRNRAGNGRPRVVHHHQRVSARIRRVQDHGAYIGLDIADIIIGPFGAEIPVGHRIGDDGPAVPDVPPEDAGPGIEFPAAEQFDEILHRLSLYALRGEDKAVQVSGNIPEKNAYLVHHQVVAVCVPIVVLLPFAHRLGLVFLVPDKTVRPGIHASRAEHLLQAFAAGHAVVAGLAGKQGVGGCVERVLVVSARAPEVILRQGLRAIMLPHQLRAPVGRGRQIVPRGVQVEQHGGDDFTRYPVAVRIGPVGLEVTVRDEHIVLVISRPEGYAGMIPQAADHCVELPFQPLLEIQCLGISGASHGKILPDHHARGIAHFVEGLIFIDVAAPAAEHVAVEVGHQGERTRQVLRVAAVQGVHRGPVTALDEHRLPVHDKAEIARPGRGVHLAALQADGADADAPPVLVQDASVRIAKAENRLVQSRVPEAARPPEMHAGKGGPMPECVRPHGKAFLPDRLSLIGKQDLRSYRIFLIINRKCQNIIHGDIGRSRRNIQPPGGPVHVADVDGPFDVQPHAPPKAGAHQPGHDIPAEGMGRLAHPGRLGPSPVVGKHGRKRFPHFQHGGADIYLQPVFRADGLQQPAHLCLAGNEHVVVRCHVPPVQPNLRVAVDAPEIQLQAVFRLMRGRDERPAVPPLESFPRA